MNNRFKFIHASDMHLGNVMNVSQEMMNYDFNSAVFESFKRLCNYAKNNDVDFIVISGDLFHSKGRDIRVDKFFYEECRNIYPINIYVICGNHDPMKDNKDIFKKPSNVIFLTSDFPQLEEVYKEGGMVCRIIGQSYYNNFEKRRLHESYEEYLKDDKVFTIGLLHTQLTEDNYVPCTLGELKNNNKVNYWALGHIHKSVLLNREKPFIGYPGIPQGCDFGEKGSGGFFCVQVVEKEIENIKFVHTSNVIWERVNVVIDENNNPNTIEELEEIIFEHSYKFIESYNINLNLGVEEEDLINNRVFIIRWVVEGRGEIHGLLKDKEDFITTYIKEELNKRLFGNGVPIFTEEIVFRTKPMINYNDLNENPFYKEVKEILELSIADNEVKGEMIKSFGKIWNYGYDEFRNDYEFNLSEEYYCEILNRAIDLIEEKILEGSE